MTKAFTYDRFGGPEVLKWADVTIGNPGPGEALVRHDHVGLNFIDTYHRTGLYPVELPSGIGMEAAGTVEAVGDGVTEVAPGDRVAYAGGPLGAYAEARLIPAHRLVRMPAVVDTRTAAAAMLQGMTAEYLLRRTFAVQPGQTILFHAAAGGVGLIACQWAKHLGATVIGTVGSDEKAEIARANGCDHVIVYSRENFTDRVREITGGAGVPVVYDGVGKSTFMGSLDCLSPRGMMVSFGNASGAVEPFNLGLLSQKGSLYVTRPTMMTYTAKREDLVATASALFDVIANGAVKITVGHSYPLAEAAEAQRALEARETTGSVVFEV
ncbi:quinone oxidoreductase family protein [Oceanibacterium hippocampi]|uniref:Quinone oxidoreductase 1 n=1 Tax=Oceanibacterium hippocampi TaxID=745714 RepID=A0A1Y5RR47_9PROT|nr:quinone oxidoreductase [Oceanibacterium hippocampi]SLN20709.1 Quinone oxidoreductase 1 [Oceanibacterium hippocampi]